ncbi:hypothetical protein CDL12_11818 [Handroanthus impetiginosus]|uniref:Uncharacterized protein n=1 Tax=Handroanthus impetiginosus TaxID=429701 RepID=A0A2G9HDE5_9LAMI|nr:hypothetical protein CDL12_11818 [Handroanthus impetiginosus]
MNSSAGNDLETLLEAIKSSEVVENRVQLLEKLEELSITEKSAVNSLVEALTIFWEDFTCLDISQCTLNKTILHVAAKCLESDVSGCLLQFLVLGTKANIWCRKHLKMTLMSVEDSPDEEHSSFFYQLVLDLLNYSAASYSALARYPVSNNRDLAASLENFISEQFTLMKDLASEVKRIQILGMELLKAVQLAVDAATRLCKVYCNGVNWDIYNAKTEDKNIGDCKETENGVHVIHVTNCTIERLCELGTAAANGGGSLVTLLNMSWKGVVSLLQFGKGALGAKVNITGVIMNLISLASESIRCAAESWSSLIKEKISVAEAKRIFLPVKFYLIHAVRIISQYQTAALSLYKDIALCVVMILTFKISFSMVEHLKSASEVLTEILVPTSLHLLNSLLNSAKVKQENKFQILDWLFSKGSDMSSESESNDSSHTSLDALISISSYSMSQEKMFTLGRVALFINLLTCAPDLEDDIKHGVAKKLGWLLDTLVDEDVYCSILVLQTPTAYGSSQNHEFTYQPVFCAVLHALKTFMIAVSSSPAWNEVESFLIENLFHPHFLCWDIITELWCFILRHAEPDMVNDIIDQFCAVLMLTSRESVLIPESALRKTARLICILVTYGPEFMADRIYSSIFDGSRSQHAVNVQIALLMEGFPLNFLSEKKRSIAKQKLVTQYYDFLESFEEQSPGESDSGVYGAPVFALCAALQSLQVSLSDTDTKTLKFLVAIIHKYKTSSDNAIKDNCRTLLSELLGIISNMKHLYSFDEMEQVILELQNLFISRPALSDSQLFLCKPNLAYFMAGVGHVELADSDDSARSSGSWELYHMLLRERHWALVHLTITAFGYFAAHTSCNQLWRFVPQDAALSYDLESGNEADEERFMSELKAVLEKEMACPVIQATPDQLTMLVKEGQVLKEIVRKNVKHESEAASCDIMDIDEEKQPNKKRKFPDGICRGVELLQSGLKVMVDGLSQWQQNQHDSTEIHEKFLTHFSRLEDAIAHLVSLADRG